MKRACALSSLDGKRARSELVDGGWFVEGVECWLHFLCCTGSLNDDNRKLEWTLNALDMEDPFKREPVVPADILECLRCMLPLSVVCVAIGLCVVAVGRKGSQSVTLLGIGKT